MPDKKEDSEKEESSIQWVYTGKEEEWETFDRRTLRYCEKKYDMLGEKIWYGTMPFVPDLNPIEYYQYCCDVWRSIESKDATQAKVLWNQQSGFFEREWQMNWLNRQYRLLFIYIEEHCKDAAETEMINFSGDRSQIRKYLYKLFGTGTGGDIHVIEIEFDKGMPEKGKSAFYRGIDMIEKLRQLETRRLYFLKMCSPSRQSTYPYCQETKLVRIVLDHINPEYDDCVARVLDLVKINKMIVTVGQGGLVGANSFETLDSHERSFSDDWLPSWKLLQTSLVSEYKRKLKSGEDSTPAPKDKSKLPVALAGVRVACYACGGAHKRGDPACKAGPNDVHPDAPQHFKMRMAAKKRKFDAGAKVNAGNDNNPKKKTKAGEKKHCNQFNFGKGTCRFGAKCRFLHEKSDGRSPGKEEAHSLNKKAIAAIVASTIRKTAAHIHKKRVQKEKAVSKEKDAVDEEDYAAILAACMFAPVKNTIPRNREAVKNVVMSANLHDVETTCGIDTDAGMSISTMREDFPCYLDESEEARRSIEAPSGINGGVSMIGGRGPMVILSKSGKYLIDPDGVYLSAGKNQPNFRVMSAQRLKSYGVRLVQCFKGTERDVLQDRVSKEVLNLDDEGPKGKSILVIKTMKISVSPNIKQIKRIADSIMKKNQSAMVSSIDDDDDYDYPQVEQHDKAMMIELTNNSKSFSTRVLAFNIAKLTEEERSRLYVRRFGYCNSHLLTRMMRDPDFGKLPKLIALNEDNPVKDAAKFRKLSHSRTDPELSMGRLPWLRTYVDGYGGGKSMGAESYEGAIGGYLFVCSSTGDMHHKLYATHEQFPAAVFQFLIHVEGEGNRCHELYCDTFAVNLSAELEEICGMFHVKIVPVSAGTPQEMSFVETAHRVVAARSRAMLLGAPHLPAWAWALADKNAVYVGRFLPQSTRDWKCSYHLNTGKVPDWDYLCIHVFGSPCCYAPMEGPVHKRGALTEEGFFVGVQHPMVLILRKRDMKLLSVSKKKFIAYESLYTSPLTYSSAKLKTCLEERFEAIDKSEVESNSAQNVLSTKSMDSHTIPPPHTTGVQKFRPPTVLDEAANSQSPSQGEGSVVPEHLSYESDLASGIANLRAKASQQIGDPGIRQRVLNSLNKAEDIAANIVKRGALKVGKKSADVISTDNIVKGHRQRVPPKATEPIQDPKASNEKEKQVKKVNLLAHNVGDIISVSPKLFDGDKPGSFSKENPERQFGIVKRVWKKKRVVQVEWNDGSTWINNGDQLRLEKPKGNVAFIITCVMVEALKVGENPLDKKFWPKDFFHALVRPDWREWVCAVKKEISSWLDFNAYSVINFKDRTPGSSIVPLGELYTRKRDDSYKFRQYLMGNLLKQGKDYDETFSSCISWDGIRWCAAVACATDKLIHGLDAVTGFLQAREQFDLYAFMPSHGEYSDLSYEDLAKVRERLMDLIQKEGEEGLKRFASAHKKESRSNPKLCYKLNSSIYGAPSANHEWEMLFQHAHVNKCGMTLSEIEPSLYIKLVVDDEDHVVDWIIANIWTDDVRYFGTEKMLRQYEEELQKHIKIKLLGVTGEFVGTEFIQDIKLGLCELKAPKYWDAALTKFIEFFPNGVKERFNPLSTYDEKVMQEEVTDEEFEIAKNLPYRELCGVLSYQASCTKLEMRYSVSVCGRHRQKWGVKQFKIMLKVFEYAYTTKHMGIIYSRGLDPHGDNNLYLYADSAHDIPRSYGCTVAMMNGGAMSLSAKKHTLTASATTHDELIEFSIAASRAVGFRNVMVEMGLEQKNATVIYQDNEAAIQIALNRGSLSKQSRHMERRILTARNKVEDHQIKPVYVTTNEMVADIGTKALPDKQFAYLRDKLNGYALVKTNHPAYVLPSYVQVDR